MRPGAIRLACHPQPDLLIKACIYNTSPLGQAIGRNQPMSVNGVATTDLILASQSPRRKYLLEQAGLTFRVIPSRIDESDLPQLPPADYVRQLAEAKARDVATKYRDSWVLGADTIVAVDDRLLGKPASAPDARKMLRRLSGISGMRPFCWP